MSAQNSDASRKIRFNGAHPIAATLYVVLFVLVGCATSWEAWEHEVHTVERTTDQTELAKIAAETEHSDVGQAAVEKLTDQAALAEVAVKAKHRPISSEDRTIGQAAVEKLTDQALLAKVAVEAPYWSVRVAAVKKLTDQALLAKFAVKDFHWEVRRAAVGNLTDQALLAKIAVQDQTSYVRVAAVEKLTNQAALAALAVGAKWLDLRVAAIGNVTNQTLLRQWAEKEPQAAIRQAAVARIADDGFLLQRLSAEPSAAVHAAIIKTLREKESLRRVALTAYHLEDRNHAQRRLWEASKDPPSDVVIGSKALKRRVEALVNESDEGRLLALVLEGEFDVLRAGAARRLRDPAALEQASLRVTDRDVLKILMAKIEDKAMLNRIAAGAADLPMRLAAVRKSGAKSWVQIFSAATAKGATGQMLGDALAAVSLFPGVQQDAVEATQEASLNLIRRGDESRIPEMVDLLEGYGDKRLAEDYLNCGQPDLGAAAQAWAGRRGYSVGSGVGSNRATWRSGR